MERTDQYIEHELEKIGKVNPPPFLLTRIEARIASHPEVSALRPRLALAALVMLVFVNVLVVGIISRNMTKNDPSRLFSAMHIQTSNQLYHE